MPIRTAGLLTIAFTLASSVVQAQDAGKPKIIQEQAGNITNVRVEGSLAATRQLDCIELPAVSGDLTPPDLHTAVLSCIGQGDYNRAARVFFVASVYSRFDAQRIVDRSAAAGGQVLILRTFAGVSPEQKQLFSKAIDTLTKDPKNFQAWCQDIKRLGPPRYFPKYLILHGLNAFTAERPLENALLPGFDLEANWARVLETNVHCPT
jgi:hypothetical protein